MHCFGVETTLGATKVKLLRLNNTMNEKEIDALISLIDDPDEQIFAHVKERIVAFGQEIIPHLENRWELNAFGSEFQHRVEDLIHHIQFESVQGSLEKWAKDGAENLFEGALIIARYQYPDLDEQAAHDNLNKIRLDLWLELNEDLTALEKVKLFNHILFDTMGFRGNKKNYYAAQNSFINAVLETRKGNPLSLSILYIVLAERLGVPIFGVNLPNHFLLAYIDEFPLLRMMENPGKEPTGDEVLFYINAFSKGALVHKSEIDAYIKELNIESQPSFFKPCSNVAIVVRLIQNLIFSYNRLGYPDKSKELNKLLATLNPRQING